MGCGGPNNQKEVFSEPIEEIITRCMAMQIPCRLVSKISIQKILRDKVGESVRDIIRQLCEWMRIDILEGNIQIDHIHLILSIPPKYSASEAIGFLKGKSAI